MDWKGQLHQLKKLIPISGSGSLKKRVREYNVTRETLDTRLICHAPFTSINFEQTGKANACCYNRDFVLGTYPENSLHEMWFGEKANTLRKLLAKGDLSHGCQICEKQLESKNFYGVHARLFDPYKVKRTITRAPHPDIMPQCFEFELENTCNLECTMCNGFFSSSIRKNREELPPMESPYDDQFVEQLVPFLPYLKDAKFLGGEPFLIPIYYKIWDKIAEYNPKILNHITTNGTVLNNRTKTVLNKLKCSIVLSIDSIKKDTYEQIRKNASYDKVMENLRFFIDYTTKKKTDLAFAVCPIKTNCYEIPDIIRFCNNKNINIWFNTVFEPFELSLRSMGLQEMEELINFYKNQNMPYKTLREQHNYDCFISLINQIQEWYNDKYEYHSALKEAHNTLNETYDSIIKESPQQYQNDQVYQELINTFIKSEFSTQMESLKNRDSIDPLFVDPDQFNDVNIGGMFYKYATHQHKETLLSAIKYYKLYHLGEQEIKSFLQKAEYILSWIEQNPDTEQMARKQTNGYSATSLMKRVDETPMTEIQKQLNSVRV